MAWLHEMSDAARRAMFAKMKRMGASKPLLAMARKRMDAGHATASIQKDYLDAGRANRVRDMIRKARKDPDYGPGSLFSGTQGGGKPRTPEAKGRIQGRPDRSRHGVAKFDPGISYRQNLTATGPRPKALSARKIIRKSKPKVTRLEHPWTGQVVRFAKSTQGMNKLKAAISRNAIKRTSVGKGSTLAKLKGKK